jgi:GNAT superfamily N-acetyltransferase
MDPIRPAQIPRDLPDIRRLWLEYVTWANAELETQYGFVESAVELVEHDLATIDRYMPPAGALLLLFDGEVAIGTVALRRLDEHGAELKRMYVQPSYRGAGLGQALLAETMATARGAGFRRIRLDSPAFMTAAHRLYRAHGFLDIDPYDANEIPQEWWGRWLFMECSLEPDRPTGTTR